jgi:hypothetical protein
VFALSTDAVLRMMSIGKDDTKRLPIKARTPYCTVLYRTALLCQALIIYHVNSCRDMLYLCFILLFQRLHCTFFSPLLLFLISVFSLFFFCYSFISPPSPFLSTPFPTAPLLNLHFSPSIPSQYVSISMLY